MLLSAGLLYQVYMETHFQIYDAALRFHVRAASDLPAEQQLKLKVRDEVLAALKPAADRAESAGELKTEVEAMLPDLARTVAETLRENGSEDSVRISVCRERFPVRRYGNMIFPAGVYEALRVDIGPAEGHNWWCVMFPSLCLPAAEDPAQLEDILTPGELDIVQGEGYEVRFKVLEWLQW